MGVPGSPYKLNALIDRATAQMCHDHFYIFLREFWHVVIHEEPVWNWHMEALCEELQMVCERVEAGLPKAYDLIINIPPGTTKSTICSVMYPAWVWTRQASQRFICLSYSDSLSTNLSIKCRDIIKSDKYQRLFGLQLRKDRSGMKYFENDAGGSRMASSVGGTLLGLHAHQIIIDDPMNAQEAMSQKERESSNQWLDHTVNTRKVDKQLTPIILIMQRLHEQDYTGHLLAKGKAIKHICLPATNEYTIKPESLASKYVDGLLDPNRMSREVLEEAIRDMGHSNFVGQYGQSPMVMGGNMIKKDWLSIVDYMPDIRWHFYIDPAFTKNELNDPTALLAGGWYENKFYIRKVMEVWKDIPELLKFIPVFAQYNGLSSSSYVKVEPKASGKDIVAMLRSYSSLNIMEGHNPTKDKITRLNMVLPKIETGRVVLVRGDWNEAFIHQLTTFPKSVHDDMVDVLVMGLQDEQKREGPGFVFAGISG